MKYLFPALFTILALILFISGVYVFDATFRFDFWSELLIIVIIFPIYCAVCFLIYAICAAICQSTDCEYDPEPEDDHLTIIITWKEEKSTEKSDKYHIDYDKYDDVTEDDADNLWAKYS